MFIARGITVSAFLLALSLLVGCASNHSLDINQRVTSWDALAKKPADATYVLNPPDAVRIEFFVNDPSLTVRTETLRQDGCITLPYVEDVQVGGMTTLQIREKLENLYSKYYKQPRILVTVAGYNSKHIYVYGEVGRQGALPYTGSMTVMDAIGAVGGVTQRAATWRVKVVRGDPDAPEITTVNLYRMLTEGDRRQDVSLAENDVVNVPPTVLAWIGYQIDQLLFPFRGVLGAAATYEGVRAVGGR